MKTTSRRFGLLAAPGFTALLLFNACKKETSGSELSAQDEEQTTVISSQADAEASLAFEDVFDNVIGVNNDVGVGGTGIFGSKAQGSLEDVARTTGCFTVNITRINAQEMFPLRVVLDFGNGCTALDGHVRSGKIITEYSGRLVVPGKFSTTTFENYKIDSFLVQGTYKITNTSTATNRQFTTDVIDGKISRPSGDYTNWASHRIITQSEGVLTPDFPLDDEFKIEGTGNGKVKRGGYLIAWQSEISEPLRKRFTCRWISKGVIKIRRERLASSSVWVGILDYGAGDCDNKAILKINNIDHQISLN